MEIVTNLEITPRMDSFKLSDGSHLLTIADLSRWYVKLQGQINPMDPDIDVVLKWMYHNHLLTDTLKNHENMECLKLRCQRGLCHNCGNVACDECSAPFMWCPIVRYCLNPECKNLARIHSLKLGRTATVIGANGTYPFKLNGSSVVTNLWVYGCSYDPISYVGYILNPQGIVMLDDFLNQNPNAKFNFSYQDNDVWKRFYEANKQTILKHPDCFVGGNLP